ncbi:phospholipase D-like domain-containing protein DpdK [Pseudarthrobacter sp. NPDC058119]|uniref:phospholipase D-like domain-containing protein DpdK n=1 Tax=Pseudarthrobacter sp. NPDC058119 TaxID=3346348 RepID=UPI0036DA43FE
MTTRRIATRGGGQTRLVNDMLQTLLVTELLDPSSELLVLSPWISDIVVIDNSAGQFKSVLPGMPARPIRVTEVLIELARRGSKVRIVIRDDPKNAIVRTRICDLPAAGHRPEILLRDNLHDKGLLSDRFHVHGSMNFTHFGQAVNEEGVTVTSDPDSIARARLDYQGRYHVS